MQAGHTLRKSGSLRSTTAPFNHEEIGEVVGNPSGQAIVSDGDQDGRNEVHQRTGTMEIARVFAVGKN